MVILMIIGRLEIFTIIALFHPFILEKLAVYLTVRLKIF